MWRLVLSLILVTKSVSLGTVIIVQDANCDDPCFRRLLTGKRLVDGYVRKTIECNKLHDCHRMCEYERGFTCEGFNYRSHPKGVCELTSMPPGRMDTGRDFIPDSQFDFYERDWTRPKCSYQSSSSTGRQKSRRPNSWWPVDGSDSIPWQGQYPSERPRGNPQGFSGQWDKSGQRRPGISSYNNRDDYWQIPLPVRPIEQEYPQRPPLASSRRPDRFNQPAERFPAGHGYERTPQYFTPVRPGPDNQIIYNGNGYSYGHRSATRQHKFPQRRIGYNSNPDTNEVTHHYPQERPLKPSYCNSCRPYSERELHGKPLSLNDHEDEYKNYGGAYDHSDHPRLPAQPPKVLPLLPEHRECAVRSISGYRLARGMIRKSYLTENLEQCESLCQHQREFTCLTFAYRYNLAPTAPADNCLMSDAVFENLIYYTDLDPDRDYDIYAMTDKSSKLCEHQRQQASSLRHPADECFWRIKSGFSMPATIVRKPMRVDGMGECQVQCVNSRDFTCRSFVFKYETFSSDGVSNCFLSDWSAGEIDQRKMQDMDGAELYERGSFGRGCEPHLPVLPLQVDQSILKTPHLDEASCYTGYDRPCKLTPWAIILTSTVNSEADCRRKCSSMRQNHLTPCMSFSYKQDDRRGDNCLLSDIPTRDLRPGFDYIHDDENYVLYAWKELEPRCSSSGQSSQFNQRHDPPPSSGYIPPKLSTESKPYTKPDDPYFQQVALSDPNRPANIENSAFNSVADYNQKFFFNIPDEMSVFHHYTVSGRRCKRGTKCERNKIVGFWACEPEGADFGSWDYCCEPSHQCGFSQGFSYPWCYVGSSPEQWRPCSETYEPNYEKPRPLRPSRPRVEDDSNNDQKEHDSRHWPIAFLHHEAPPNGTDSIALANHVKDQTTNETIVSNSGGDDPGVVVPIEINNNSTNTTTHLERRGETSENEDEILTIVPLEIAENRTEESSERLSSSLKIQPVDNSSSSYKNISGRFSRENNGQQYLFTKRLNAGLSTMQKKIPDFSEAGGNGGRGFVAKIERVNKSNDVIVNNDNLSTRGQRLVTLSSSKGTSTSNSTIIPPVLQNTLTVIPTNISTERHWQKIEVVEKSHD